DICAVARKARTPALLSTVAVNLKDFPPLGSLHRAGLSEPEKMRWDALYEDAIAAEKAARYDRAIDLYKQAARLDDHFAELHFRLARCYFASAQFSDAQRHYRLARDWDALQFRTDSRRNGIIGEVVSGKTNAGVWLADAEKAIAESPLSEHQIPGGAIFNDHVHFSFDGDYVLASTLLLSVVSLLGLANMPGFAGTGPPSSRAECAEELAFTSWEEVNVAAGMVHSLANPPFLDQLEHAERQARAEQTIQQRMAQF